MDLEVERHKKKDCRMPVVDHLESLDAKARAKVFWEIELLQQHGLGLGAPYAKRLKGGRTPRQELEKARRFGTRLTMREGAGMNRASVRFSEVKERLLKDEGFRKEYERLRPRYEVVSLLIEARKMKSMTQRELAMRVGTQKSNISRLESGTYNPSLDFLIRVARGLGKEVRVTLEPMEVR